MTRWVLGILFLIGCALSAAAGFWFGFREAWPLGVQADYLPRGAVAADELSALRAGNTHPVVIGLEYEVDRGLVWGNALFHHPMRRLWEPLWGLDVYPEYEKYATRLADYRKQHPSSLKPEAFGPVPGGKQQYFGTYRGLSRDAQDTRETIDLMVQRYATRR